MPTLTREESERIEELVQNLLAIQKQNDNLVFGGDPFDVGMRQIPKPPEAVISQCREILALLRTRNIEAPCLFEFVHDPSPFVIKNLMHELRDVETSHGEE